jgi:hypothetical protein
MQTPQGSSPTAEHWSRASIEPLGFGDCLWRRLRRDADPKDVAPILDFIHMGGILVWAWSVKQAALPRFECRQRRWKVEKERCLAGTGIGVKLELF